MNKRLAGNLDEFHSDYDFELKRNVLKANGKETKERLKAVVIPAGEYYQREFYHIEFYLSFVFSAYNQQT